MKPDIPGMNKHNCPTCNGRGEVPVYGRVGEGVLYHKQCPQCKGTAEVEEADGK